MVLVAWVLVVWLFVVVCWGMVMWFVYSYDVVYSQIIDCTCLLLLNFT